MPKDLQWSLFASQWIQNRRLEFRILLVVGEMAVLHRPAGMFLSATDISELRKLSISLRKSRTFCFITFDPILCSSFLLRFDIVCRDIICQVPPSFSETLVQLNGRQNGTSFDSEVITDKLC
jgi:hypothetical protein